MARWRLLLEVDDPDELTSTELREEVREVLDDHYIHITRLTIEPVTPLEVVKETDPTTGITHWQGVEG